jgi:hypothetical protein
MTAFCFRFIFMVTRRNTMLRIHILKDDAPTLTLAERVERIWEAYLAQDAPAHAALLADDYRAVHPDGSIHVGKPTVGEIAAAPIEDYWLRELQAWPVGEEGAIVSYSAEVEVRNGLQAERHRFAVGVAA